MEGWDAVSFVEVNTKGCPRVSSVLLWKNSSLYSSGPEVGPVSRHFVPLVQPMSLPPSGLLSLCPLAAPRLALCPDLSDLLWDPGGCQGHMAAVERKYVNKRDEHMLLDKREQESSLLSLGQDKEFFKLTNFPILYRLALILSLTNPFPRSFGVLCPLSNPILFPGQALPLMVATLVSTVHASQQKHP